MRRIIKLIFKLINPIILIIVLMACISAYIWEKPQIAAPYKISNIYYDLFKREFCINHESLILLFEGGIWTITTNYLADKVMMSAELADKLNKLGLTIDKCLLIIHNHWALCRFSNEDKDALRLLRSTGFKGKFAIWCHANADIFYLED